MLVKLSNPRLAYRAGAQLAISSWRRAPFPQVRVASGSCRIWPTAHHRTSRVRTRAGFVEVNLCGVLRVVLPDSGEARRTAEHPGCPERKRAN